MRWRRGALSSRLPISSHPSAGTHTSPRAVACRAASVNAVASSGKNQAALADASTTNPGIGASPG